MIGAVRASSRATAIEETRTSVVLLGASNLTLAFPTAIECFRARLGAPLRVLVARGHGRSYGLPTRVLGRWLPSIAECGLWRDLAGARSSATIACVTDAGNDVMYGAPVREILGWVERDLDLLLEARARIVLTRVPLVSIESLTPTRYGLLRALFFPSRRISRVAVLAQLHRLDEGLVELARARDVSTVEPHREWYGWDPIHVRRDKRRELWDAILDAAEPDRAPTSRAGVAPSLARHEKRALAELRPELRRMFAFEQRRSQPALEWPDGSTFAAY